VIPPQAQAFGVVFDVLDHLEGHDHGEQVSRIEGSDVAADHLAAGRLDEAARGCVAHSARLQTDVLVPARKSCSHGTQPRPDLENRVHLGKPCERSLDAVVSQPCV